MNPYLEAARPKTLFNAIAPVIAGVGAGLTTLNAMAQPSPAFMGGPVVTAHGQVDWWAHPVHTLTTGGIVMAVILCFIIALSATVAVNYANDLFDGLAGNDSPDRTGPRRAVASGLLSPQAMGVALVLAMTVFIGSGLALVWLIQSWALLGVGVGCALLLLAYSAGPFPLASHGLGEVAVFLTFGLAATMGTAFAISGIWLSGLFPAIGVGAYSCAVLEANNIRDIPEDTRHNKRTLAVRLGGRGARLFYVGLTSVPIIISAWSGFHMVVLDWVTDMEWFVPHSGLTLGLIAIPLTFHAQRIVNQGASGGELIPVLAITGKAMTLWALAGAIGQLIAPLIIG